LREFDGVRAADEGEMARLKKGLGLTMCEFECFLSLDSAFFCGLVLER
jgi:hypothetical protein